MDSLPIGEYALLSDCRSAALVSRGGSVDWLCFPRFDGPSVFCHLLDPAGGRFAIRPEGEFRARRRYVDQTMVLETTFTTAGGIAVLTDALAVGRNERGHDLGTGSPSVLLRRLACTQGTIDAEITYAPRPEYGLVHPILVPVPGGLAARGGADRLLLSSPVAFDVEGATAAHPCAAEGAPARVRIHPERRRAARDVARMDHQGGTEGSAGALRRLRPAEEVALSEIAPEAGQSGGLLGGLDPFAHHEHAGGTGDGHDRPAQRSATVRIFGRDGQRAIQLDHVDGQHVQRGERSVAGVVQREPDAARTQPLQDRPGRADVGHASRGVNHDIPATGRANR